MIGRRYGWRYRLRREVRREGLVAVALLAAALTLLAVGLSALPHWPVSLSGPILAFALGEFLLGLRQARYWRRLSIFERNA